MSDETHAVKVSVQNGPAFLAGMKEQLRAVAVATAMAEDQGLHELSEEGVVQVRLIIRTILAPDIDTGPGKMGVAMLTSLIQEVDHRVGTFLAATLAVEGMEKGARMANPAMHAHVAQLTEKVADLEDQLKKGLN
jgi:hypothetical protein